MLININNKNVDRISIIYFSIMIVLFTLVRNKLEFTMLVHCLYAAFLIVIVIIMSKTIKFNPNTKTTFLGVICATIGILEVTFILININYISFELSYFDYGFCLFIDLLKLIGIYSSFYLSLNKIKLDEIFTRFIKLLSVSLMISILFSFIIKMIFNISSNLFIIIESTITILTCVTFIIIRNNIRTTKDDSLERNLLFRIILLFTIARFIMVTIYIIYNLSWGYQLSKFVSNMWIYYIYRYIYYINIKKPYEELSEINERLKLYSRKLSYKNERIILEMKKTQMLKDRLNINDQKLRLTINSAMNPTIIFSNNKDIIYSNKSFEIEFSDGNNYSIDYMLRSKFKEYNKILETVNTVIDKGKEIKINIESENSKFYKVILTPFIINNKNEGCLCIFMDNTKETVFEKETISMNLCYDNFLESINDGILLLENRKILYANNACKKMFKNDLSVIDTYIAEDKNIKEEIYIIDGEKIYVEMIYSKYSKDKVSIVIRNITERKVAEERLKERKESYSRLIDILPDGICLLDYNYNIKYLNQSILNIVNINNDYDSYTIRDIIKLSSDEEILLLKNLRKVIKNNQHFILLNKQLISKNNVNIDVEINAIPFSDDGNNKYIMLIIKDLTNKKTSELVEKELSERLETDKVKTEFFTSMSHELKTPLNVIFSSNQLLESFYKSGKINDYNNNINSHIDLVKTNSYRLQRLINNIIDLTKLESGFYRLNLSKSNIVEIVEDLFMKIEKYARKKNIGLVFDTESEEINLFIDKSEIERIMLNLLSNCVKFTPNNEEIIVNIYDRENSACISVKNTGIGIPKDKLDTIFEEFSQVDKTLSRNTEGSGIGLSIVKNLVELHGGKIEVKSEENKETEFIITLNKNKQDNLKEQKNKAIYNIEEKINIEFSDIYY